MVIISIYFVDLESLMSHTKFQDRWISGYEEQIFKGFYHKLARGSYFGHVT